MNVMAMTPDVYFEDMWDDARMGDVFEYLRKRDRTWTPVSQRIMSMVPWSRFVYVDTIQ